MKKLPNRDFRSPLAKARDRWFESEDGGKKLCDGTASWQYLRNRLERAFIAGAKVGERLALKK